MSEQKNTSEDPAATEQTEQGEEPLDPVTKALKVGQARAEARKAIAEANAGTADALLPTIPAELPVDELKVAEAGSALAQVSSYRAALDCMKAIAKEVAEVGVETIWVTDEADRGNPLVALDQVELAFKHLGQALADALADLDSELPAFEPSVEGADLDEVDGPKTFAVGPTTVAAAAVSAGLPLVFDALSSTTTVKGASSNLHTGSLLDMVSHELLDESKKVVRSDAVIAINAELLSTFESIRDTCGELRLKIHQTTESIADVKVELDPLKAKRTLLEGLAAGKSARGDLKLEDELPEVDSIEEVARKMVPHESSIAVLSDRAAYSQGVLDRAETALEALAAPDSVGNSPLSYASFAKNLAAASCGDPPWVRLEVAAATAGGESVFEDRPLRDDKALYVGATAITYRLIDSDGNLRKANTYWSARGLRLDLGDGRVIPDRADSAQ